MGCVVLCFSVRVGSFFSGLTEPERNSFRKFSEESVLKGDDICPISSTQPDSASRSPYQENLPTNKLHERINSTEQHTHTHTHTHTHKAQASGVRKTNLLATGQREKPFKIERSKKKMVCLVPSESTTRTQARNPKNGLHHGG